jgi:hypothetical protein
MNIDTGLAVVIAAVLIFYLRLIILQRERARRLARAAAASGKKKKAPTDQPPQSYSLLSQNKRDLAIGLLGLLLMLVGVLLNRQVFPLPAAQAYWWLPTAFGIVAFSWMFRL